MEKLKFSTRIAAPKDEVWNALWDDTNYRKWTSAFSDGSYAETDWKEGSKILFLDGKGSGMVSRIAKVIPNEYMSFEHLGEVKDGTENMETKSWTGSHENYTLNEMNGVTTLETEVDISEEFKDFFVKTFPKALDKVKEIAEGKN